VQQLGIGWKADVLRLHRGVDRDPLKVLAPQRAVLVRYPADSVTNSFSLIIISFSLIIIMTLTFEKE
jgi:hypothetical protein